MVKNNWGGNRIPAEQTLNALITKNHYKWCKANSRDISWYKKKKPKEYEIKKGTKFGDQINLYFKKRDQLKKLKERNQSAK